MNSIGENCNELKKQYDSCFLSWFSDKFLKGETNDAMCAPIFKVYQQCVQEMEACREIKEQYDHCFNMWFSGKFLRGDNDEQMCAPLLKIYKDCVEKAIKDNHIELKDVGKEVIGSKEENQVPPTKIS